MERQATQPLNPLEAKARLRAAASGGQAVSWVWNHPKESVLAAFILGFLVGVSATARDVFVSAMVAVLKRLRL